MTEPMLQQNRERATDNLDVDAQLVDDIVSLVETGQQGMVLNLVADLHPADLARLISHMPVEQAYQLFEWLPAEKAGDVLVELDDEYRATLLEGLEPGRVTALLEELDTDDATDIVADLPEEVVQEVLHGLEDAHHVRELLAYDEESAGGLMEREYVAVPRGWTIAEVTEEVRRMADVMEHIYMVYVVDDEGRLEGALTLKKILLSPADARVEEVMDTGVVSVRADVDQEEVARIMERYDLVALPVVDEAGRLIGRITIDDVVDVIREEAEEDIQLMSGVTGGGERTDWVLRITRGRLPWLLGGLVGAGLSGFVIGGFEDALEEAVILAAFIPVMMATAGNVGIQCSAIIVQGLASGDVWVTDIFKRLGKELAVALLNGLALALVLGLAIIALPWASPAVAGMIESSELLALTAGLALILVILLATVIGTTVPLFLHRIGIDPALATGPFITTSNDILGLTVYFLIASVLYL